MYILRRLFINVTNCQTSSVDMIRNKKLCNKCTRYYGTKTQQKHSETKCVNRK